MLAYVLVCVRLRALACARSCVVVLTLIPPTIFRFDNHFRYDDISADYYKNEGGDEEHLERILKWYSPNPFPTSVTLSLSLTVSGSVSRSLSLSIP